MAHYVRFEIYVPVVYITYENDPSTHRLRQVKHAMDDSLVSEFIAETCGKYQGITESNPISAAPYKGWWKEKPDSPASIDYLTYMFGLVRVDESHEAKDFFASWKTRIEGT